jgi:hypothetical protein
MHYRVENLTQKHCFLKKMLVHWLAVESDFHQKRTVLVNQILGSGFVPGYQMSSCFEKQDFQMLMTAVLLIQKHLKKNLIYKNK